MHRKIIKFQLPDTIRITLILNNKIYLLGKRDDIRFFEFLLNKVLLYMAIKKNNTEIYLKNLLKSFDTFLQWNDLFVAHSAMQFLVSLMKWKLITSTSWYILHNERNTLYMLFNIKQIMMMRCDSFITIKIISWKTSLFIRLWNCI